MSSVASVRQSLNPAQSALECSGSTDLPRQAGQKEIKLATNHPTNQPTNGLTHRPHQLPTEQVRREFAMGQKAFLGIEWKNTWLCRHSITLSFFQTSSLHPKVLLSSVFSLPRSSSRKLRIRVPSFFYVVYFRGTLPSKKG